MRSAIVTPTNVAHNPELPVRSDMINELERHRHAYRADLIAQKKWQTDISQSYTKLKNERQRLSTHLVVLQEQANKQTAELATVNQTNQQLRHSCLQQEATITNLKEKLADAPKYESVIGDLMRQLDGWEQRHQTFVYGTLNGAMKDRDCMVADLQDQLLQLQAGHKSVLMQLTGASQECQRLMTLVADLRRSEATLRTMLEMQRATNDTKLRAIDDKYNQVKKMNLTLMQRIVDLELQRSQAIQQRTTGNGVILASRSASPVLPFGDASNNNAPVVTNIDGGSSTNVGTGTSPLTTSTMFAPIVHSNSASSISPSSELVGAGQFGNRGMVRRNTDSPPAVGAAARTLSSGSAAGDNGRHHGLGHINNNNNAKDSSSGGAHEWATLPSYTSVPRIGFPQPQLHRPRPHLPTDDDDDDDDNDEDQLAPLATRPSGVNVDDYSPPTSGGGSHSGLAVHTQTPPGRKNDHGFDHHHQQQQQQQQQQSQSRGGSGGGSPNLSRTNSPLRPRPATSAMVSPHHVMGTSATPAVPFTNNINSPSNLRKRSTSPHYPPSSTASSVISSSSSSSSSSISMTSSVAMEASAVSSSTSSSVLSSSIPSPTPHGTIVLANPSPSASPSSATSAGSSSLSLSATATTSIVIQAAAPIAMMTSNLSPLLATRRAEQSAAAAAALANGIPANGITTIRARTGGPTAFMASPYSSQTSSVSFPTTTSTTATSAPIPIAANVPLGAVTTSTLASLDISGTAAPTVARAAQTSAVAYPTYGFASSTTSNTSATTASHSSAASMASAAHQQHQHSHPPHHHGTANGVSSPHHVQAHGSSNASSSSLANALKSRPIPISISGHPNNINHNGSSYGVITTAAIPMPIGAKKANNVVNTAAPVRRPVMNTLDIEPSSPPSV